METDERARCLATGSRIDERSPACDEPRPLAAPRDTFPGRRTTPRFNTERVAWSNEW